MPGWILLPGSDLRKCRVPCRTLLSHTDGLPYPMPCQSHVWTRGSVSYPVPDHGLSAKLPSRTIYPHNAGGCVY